MLAAADCGVRLKHTEFIIDDKRKRTENADFVITEFAQLQRLIFAHGYSCHRQVSYVTCFYFYKNVILVVIEVLF